MPASVVVAGGGAAGVFGAIACAEANPGARILVCEKTAHFLSKVRISGGGRCNVTHACFDAREFATRYPRGGRALIGVLQRFPVEDTIRWFEARGVALKVEKDGRMFPVTDSSQTVIDCLLREARRHGIELRANSGVEAVRRGETGFRVGLGGGEAVDADCVLLATGGCRSARLGAIAEALGHTIEPPVPSLFTFHVEAPWLRELAGVSVPEVAASVAETKLREQGALLVTHWGVSGPAILKLSAWGARELHAKEYRFTLLINWLPGLNRDEIQKELGERAARHAAKLVTTLPIAAIPARLWAALVGAAGISQMTRWSGLGRAGRHQLVEQLTATRLEVRGKSLNKDEFVTCGGVRLDEVNFKTMESKVCRGLYFAGELLDIDGITGGFNFQAAWTTGWIAGRSIGLALRTTA